MRDDKISQKKGAALRAPSSFGEVNDSYRAAMAVGAVLREPFSGRQIPEFREKCRENSCF